MSDRVGAGKQLAPLSHLQLGMTLSIACGMPKAGTKGARSKVMPKFTQTTLSHLLRRGGRGASLSRQL